LEDHHEVEIKSVRSDRTFTDLDFCSSDRYSDRAISDSCLPLHCQRQSIAEACFDSGANTSAAETSAETKMSTDDVIAALGDTRPPRPDGPLTDEELEQFEKLNQQIVKRVTKST
jgi:hypothetical protein